MNAAVAADAVHGVTPHVEPRPLPQAAAAAFAHPQPANVRIALLGTGTVGKAVLARLVAWRRAGFAPHLQLMHVENSHCAFERSTHSNGEWTVSSCTDAEYGAGRRDSDIGILHALEAFTAEGRIEPVASTGSDPGCAVCLPAITAAAPLNGPFAGATHARRNRPSPLGRGLRAAPGKSRTQSGDTGVTADSFSFTAFDSEASIDPKLPHILIDATASDAIAARHAQWLAQGIHVVTACKLGGGTTLARWCAIREAQDAVGARYGDSATVGAGLPLLSSIRALRAGGDRIHAIAGVLSGSLAWLFHHYDGLRPFSGFVRQAREAGYTEPDPRDDLSGEDVRRKLLILARAAGVEMESDAVAVESLVPSALAALPTSQVDAALRVLDAPLRERFAAAYKCGETLRFIARLEDGRARVGLESLPIDHPLAGGAGIDNRVAIWSDRYREKPLVIQGPGAGAEVTAAALLDDVLAIAIGRSA
jgi:homoserine dehydrogenase